MKGECGHVIALSFLCVVVYDRMCGVCDMWMVRLVTLEKIRVKQNWQLAIQRRKVSKVQNQSLILLSNIKNKN